jgi:signal transduction histidine kinase
MTDPLQQLNGAYEPMSGDSSLDAQRASDEQLQVALSRVTHDINNPLSIISGNAQLLLELAQVLDLDPDVAKPIRDIEEASQRLARMVGRLNRLNDAARQDDHLEGGAS